MPAASNVKSDCILGNTRVEKAVQMTKVPGGRKRFRITKSQVLQVAKALNPRIPMLTKVTYRCGWGGEFL